MDLRKQNAAVLELLDANDNGTLTPELMRKLIFDLMTPKDAAKALLELDESDFDKYALEETGARQ